MSHDTVRAKSDIDLVLVTIDDRKVVSSGASLFADGMNVHALLMPRAEFRQAVEGSLRNSFTHSFLTKGRLLYTHDESIADLCASTWTSARATRRCNFSAPASMHSDQCTRRTSFS
ncbi:MAG: hypothetical protein U0163_09310 [Gemmatimonadaceae bacterium]